MVYWLKKRNSITDCLHDHDISSLSTRRRELDILFLRKTEAGLFDVCWASEIGLPEKYVSKIISIIGYIIQWVKVLLV